MIVLALALLPQGSAPYTPEVAEASGEGLAAMAGFSVAAGCETELVAAEPALANPVCLYIDHRGDLYVNETFRHHAGVTDVREKYHLMERDVANRTVADRVAMLRDDAGAEFEASYGREQERIRLLRDLDRDGTYEQSLVFADGFDDPAAGIAAGVLSYRGDVFYACIPDLWRLRDTDGDGRADERDVLSTGYGVNVAMLGHDLHGLRIGPDGRLYFSCGDRGFHVETPDGVLDHSHCGAVLRCELDGSDLEVYATGLRNPQELAFDAYGDLFTGDNNSDGGDRARWVQVLDGGDSGWRYGYQWLDEPLRRGPWNDEKLWHPQHPGQAAYLVPPIANLAAGPSGLTYYPGTGLPAEYDGHFFLCDFRGESSISGIHTFGLTPNGAGWELGPVEPFVWGTLCTDVDFGPDGALYFCDWVSGWEKTGKGRIYRTSHPAARASADAQATERLLREGFEGRGLDELTELLAAPDQRVRQEAQFELVRRAPQGVARLVSRAGARAERPGSLFARLHAIWGVGMVGRRDIDQLEALLPLLDDDVAEVRAQVARVLGEGGLTAAGPKLVPLLDDAAPRVRYHAAAALGRLGPFARDRSESSQGALEEAGAVPALLAALRECGADDPVLRHGLIRGLVACCDEEQLATLGSPHREVRRALVVTLRHKRSARVARYLADEDPWVVEEAARAIHDLPIEEAFPALAAALEEPPLAGNVVVRRALNANFRLGDSLHAERIAAFAASPVHPSERRLEALQMLAQWSDPPSLDWVMGEWRPVAPRSDGVIPMLVRRLAGAELAEPELTRAWIDLVVQHDLGDFAERLAGWARSDSAEMSVRTASLDALEQLRFDRLPALLREGLADAAPAMRAASLATLERVVPGELAPVLEQMLRTGGRDELRACYGALGRSSDPRAVELLADELDQLAAGLVAAELALDLVSAAEENGAPVLAQKLTERRPESFPDPTLAPWLDSLYGGDAERGRAVFGRAETSCTRCHRIDHPTGTEVGPDLRDLSERMTRLQILESIVAPNRRITAGFGSWTFLLHSGELVAGRILAEDDETIRVQTIDAQLFELAPEEIEVRREGLSGMPTNAGESLSRDDMRDLIEYLSGV